MDDQLSKFQNTAERLYPEEQVLIASVHDVRQMATILRGVNIHGRAVLEISDAGLHIRVEEAKIMMALAWIPVSLFDEYKFVPPSEDSMDPPNTTIDIPLDDLLECLNIFGTAISSSSGAPFDRKKKKWRQASDDEDDLDGRSKARRGAAAKGNTTIDQFFSPNGERRTGMRMSYAGAGHPLKLILAEDAAGPITTCEVQTMTSEPFSDLPFDSSRKVIYAILQSSWLRDAITELDPSCDRITFIGTPESDALLDSGGNSNRSIKPRLRLSAKGTVGNSSMDYPNDREVLETFECAMPVKFTYHVVHVKSALRALQSSSKTALRINDEGLLSLQFMINKIVAIEFRCLPFEDDI